MSERTKGVLTALGYVGIYVAMRVLCCLFAFFLAGEVSEDVYFEALPFSLVASGIGTLVVCLCIHLVRRDDVLSEWGMNKLNPWGILPAVLVGPALAAFVVYWKCIVPFPVEWMWKFDDYAVIPMMENLSVLGVAYVFFIRPIAGEVIFRGLVYAKLRTSLSMVWAILISALLNGLIAGNPLGFIDSFLFAALAALLFEWTKSVWITIIFRLAYSVMEGNFDMYVDGLKGGHVLWFGVSVFVIAVTVCILFMIMNDNEDWKKKAN